MFASFTRVFEESDDKEIWDTCLEGMVFCIKLLGISNMETEKDTYLFFLTKNSGLLHEGQEITEKNILCIKQVINCALSCGNYLNESWKEIVKCIANLDYLCIMGSQSGNQNSAHSHHHNS